MVERRAADGPDSVYLTAPETGRNLTFGELEGTCRALAAWLDRAGVQRGSHVALLLANGTQAVRLFVGIMAAGRVVVPLSLIAPPARTGDLGQRDADGFYVITGRRKELIIKGGENIAPREIDEVLLRHPAVLEAAAVGVPDPAYGEDIEAAVVLKPGAEIDASSLRDFCRGELGRFKAPRLIRIVAELPKGPSGKVQRLKLRNRTGA